LQHEACTNSTEKPSAKTGRVKYFITFPRVIRLTLPLVPPVGGLAERLSADDMLQDFQKNYMNIKKPAKSGFDPKTLGKDFTTYLKREYQNLNLKSRAEIFFHYLIKHNS